MGFTDQISALIFALIILGVLIYVIMSKFVIGPLTSLKKAEKIVLSLSIVGIALVVIYAATELIFRVVF